MADSTGRFGRVRPYRVFRRLWVAAAAVCALAGCNHMAGWASNESGKSFYRNGRLAEAREEFRRAAADLPGNPNYVHNYATASRRMGDAASAEKAYRHALHIDPSHQPSYHGLAVTLKDTGRSGEAHALLSDWVATQPYSEKPYVEMAWLQQELGDYTGAERSLTQALQIRPGHPLALANLGVVYERTGRPGMAKTVYQRSLATDWNQPQVASRLAALNRPELATGGPVVVSTSPGAVVASGPVGTPVASLPGGVIGSPPYRPTPGGGFASHPFTPTPSYGLATQPFTPGGNVPLASRPFQPAPNLPLSSQPFSPSQAYLSVPPGGPTPAFGPGQNFGTATPYVRGTPTTAGGVAPTGPQPR